MTPARASYDSPALPQLSGRIAEKYEPIDSFDDIEKITVIDVSVYSEKEPGRFILDLESPLTGKQTVFGESE